MCEMKEEIWKDIEGYEGYYQISNTGRVKSLERDIFSATTGEKINHRYEHIKAPVNNTDGYPSIKLCVNGVNKTIAIHRLVAQAFVPNPDGKLEVNHIDMDRTNNNSDNLEWVSHEENVAHSVKYGKYKHYGSDNPNYGNHTLHEYYNNNYEVRMSLGRPREQNGRCRRISVSDDDGLYMEFPFIGACCEWVIKYLNINTTVRSMRQSICTAISKNKLYHNLHFQYL